VKNKYGADVKRSLPFGAGSASFICKERGIRLHFSASKREIAPQQAAKMNFYPCFSTFFLFLPFTAPGKDDTICNY
jgi:hypothetical protein